MARRLGRLPHPIDDQGWLKSPKKVTHLDKKHAYFWLIGLSVEETAERLNITWQTVEGRRLRLLSFLGINVTDQAHLRNPLPRLLAEELEDFFGYPGLTPAPAPDPIAAPGPRLRLSPLAVGGLA